MTRNIHIYIYYNLFSFINICIIFFHKYINNVNGKCNRNIYITTLYYVYNICVCVYVFVYFTNIKIISVYLGALQQGGWGICPPTLKSMGTSYVLVPSNFTTIFILIGWPPLHSKSFQLTYVYQWYMLLLF